MKLARTARLIIATVFPGILCITPNVASGQGGRSDTGPLEPQAALQSFELRPGFRMELVASEPLVQDPVAMAFDERGTLFVVEYPEFNHYQMPREKRRKGRVRRLIDTNADGRYDRATTFLEVPFATAVICSQEGVFVGAPPDILFCRDTNDDGVADEKRVVLTGFGKDFAGGGLLNSFRWSLDNRIHMATGFAGGRVRHPDQAETEAVDIRGRSVVLDPRTLEFELTSGGGQHGLAINNDGREFLCSNVFPLQMLVYDDRYTSRNPYFAPPQATLNINAAGALAKLNRISPLEPWRVGRSQLTAKSDRRNDEQALPGGVFTSASGITAYRGDAFPAEYSGNLFVGEVANNLVYRARLEDHGVELGAVRTNPDSEFLASRDNWFRPVQFANGPDGALYVVDMYRQLIEGAAFVPRDWIGKLDPALGMDRGRIYRIVPRSHVQRPAPRLDLLETRELIELLSHPNGWHRDTASRLLLEQRAPSAVPLLSDLLVNGGSPQTRLLALSALRQLRSLPDDLLRTALKDRNARVRELAVQATESTAAEPDRFLNSLLQLVEDPSPRVRLQLAFTLGEFRGQRRVDGLATLAAQDADDQWMLMAVQSSLAADAGLLFSRMTADQQASSAAGIRRLLSRLAMQIGLQGEPAEVASVLNSLTTMQKRDAEFARELRSALFSRVRRQQIQRLATSESTQEMVARLLDESQSLVLDVDQDTGVRIEAVRTLRLVEFSDNLLALFQRILGEGQPVELQRTACDTLAAFKDDRVATLLFEAWPRLTPSVRQTALTTLTSRRSWTARLLEAVESGEVSQNEIDTGRLRRLRDESSGQLRQQLDRLVPKSEGRESVVAARRSALSMTGSAAQGKKVFERVCAACHRHGSTGKDLAPPLNDTVHRPGEALLVDILDPNRQVKPLYHSYVVQTRDGRTYSGMIREETQNAIRLVHPDGKQTDLLRIHIESLRSTGVSFMPEGLEKQIDQQAMADLLSYLGTR